MFQLMQLMHEIAFSGNSRLRHHLFDTTEDRGANYSITISRGRKSQTFLTINHVTLSLCTTLTMVISRITRHPVFHSAAINGPIFSINLLNKLS